MITVWSEILQETPDKGFRLEQRTVASDETNLYATRTVLSQPSVSEQHDAA